VDGRHVISADRYGKIRVSQFPRGFNIDCFCLGHEDLVTDLLCPASHPELLISSSLDGTLRVWRYADGACLQRLAICEKDEDAEPVLAAFSPASGLVAVNVRGTGVLHLYSIAADAEHAKVTTTATTTATTLTTALQSVQVLETAVQSHLAACFDAAGRLWISGRSVTSDVLLQLWTRSKESSLFVPSSPSAELAQHFQSSLTQGMCFCA
jgi:hypothetical protein